MPDAYASALPRKRFFLEMFTRDLSLQDCILDLIDNSIDGLIRTNDLDLGDSFLAPNGHAGAPSEVRATINVTYSRDKFVIADNCGGISREDAAGEVFNFGHSKEEEDNLRPNQLGVYGIGLKRAIFKIGNSFEMESRTVGEGFRTTVNVQEWSEKDKKITDWRFPLTYIPGAKSKRASGTTITVTEIPPEIQSLLADPTIETALHRSIAQTYALFLSRYVNVTLNGLPVAPVPIPIGLSKDYDPAIETWEDDEVKVRLIAGLATRGDANEWKAEQAGWYVLCNGRVIVAADKTELTGWGAGILPQFHSSKARGFVGIAMFYSKNPLKLPWTTTKRSLNRESSVFLRVRERMANVARPVYSFLEGLYKSNTDVTPEERAVMTGVATADLRAVAERPTMGFTVRRRRASATTKVRVQYNAEMSDLELIREHLREPNLPATQIGMQTFEYFLDQEGLR